MINHPRNLGGDKPHGVGPTHSGQIAEQSAWLFAQHSSDAASLEADALLPENANRADSLLADAASQRALASKFLRLSTRAS